MHMFLEAFFPESLGASYVAKLALCARIFVNYTGQERLRKFILERKARGESFSGFEDNFDVASWSVFSNSSDQIVLYFPRCGT